MSNPLKTILLTGALAGLMAGSLVACSGDTTVADAEKAAAEMKADAEKKAAEMKADAEKKAAEVKAAAAAASQGDQDGKTASHACKGMNDCKGHGGCKVEGQNECKGKNPCKAKGGCKTT